MNNTEYGYDDTGNLTMDYRTYVGPYKNYDKISALVFNLLTTLGLREYHTVLDVGCGSLRCARLLIPYLNTGNYFGIEPNKWLVEAGIANEISQGLVDLKKPTFSFDDSIQKTDFGDNFKADFAVAQSIFSHTGLDLLKGWLSDISTHLTEEGVMAATFHSGKVSKWPYGVNNSGWKYPGCFNYSFQEMSQIAAEYELKFNAIDWMHPHQQSWAIFSKKRYNSDKFRGIYL